MTLWITTVYTSFPSIFRGVIREMYVYKMLACLTHLASIYEGEQFVSFVEHSAFYL